MNQGLGTIRETRETREMKVTLALARQDFWFRRISRRDIK